MEDGVRVNRNVFIPAAEIDLSFSTSSGPGGQHANKAATRVDLAWNVETSAALGPRQKQRVRERMGHRIDRSGVLRLSSDRFRSQTRNRVEVMMRMAELLADALRPQRARVPTAPTQSARERRLRDKQRRAQIKRARRAPEADD
jgi:ribosome-associated protein